MSSAISECWVILNITPRSDAAYMSYNACMASVSWLFSALTSSSSDKRIFFGVAKVLSDTQIAQQDFLHFVC